MSKGKTKRKGKSVSKTKVKHKTKFSNPDLPVRALHQERNWKDREVDEQTTEELVTKAEWVKNPKKLDYKNVDTALPEGFALNQYGTYWEINADPEDPEYTDEQAKEDYDEGEESGDIHRKIGGTAAYLRADDHSVAGYLHLDAIYTYQAFRYAGLSNILLRNLTNYADENQLAVHLTAQPFEQADFMQSQESYEYNPFIPEKEDTKTLIKYYEQFGFKRVGKMDELDGTFTQKMIRKTSGKKTVKQVKIGDFFVKSDI